MYLWIYITTYLHTIYLDWLQAVLEWKSRCAWRWRWSELRDTFRGRDQASLEMHLEAVIERVWRYTWRPWSSEFVDALRGHDRATVEAVIERVWRYTSRPWWSEFGEALGGHDRANLEAVIERVWICTCRPWSSEPGGRNRASLDMYWAVVNGQRAGCCDSFHQLVNSQPWECDKVTCPLSCHGELAGGGRSCREARRKLKLRLGVNS